MHLLQKSEVQSNYKTTNKSLPPTESHQAVIDFYSSDKISWKDCVSVIKDGNKVHVLKKIMLSTVREAFEVFKEEKPDVKMGSLLLLEHV